MSCANNQERSAPRFPLARFARAVSLSLLLAGGCAQAATASGLFSSATVAPGASGGKRLIQVQPDVAALEAARRGQVLQLSLPGVGKFDVIFDGSLPQGGGTQWMGHLKDGLQYGVVLQLSSQGVTGELRTPRGTFELGHANGNHWIVSRGEADPSVALARLPSMLRTDTAAAAGVARARPERVAHAVNFDLPRMSALKPGDSVAFHIPGRGSYEVVYDDTRGNDQGSSTWVGHLKDYGTDFRVIITSGPEGSVGNILTPVGEMELTMAGSQQWLVDRQASGLKSFTPDHSDGVHPDVSALLGKAPQVAGAAATTGTGTTTTATTTATAAAFAGPVVDVLVLHTPGFVTVRGSQWRLRIDQLMALANQAYIDSGVNLRVRLVGVEQVNVADTNSNTTTLTNLASANAAAGFSGVPALRTKYGADLVSLVRPFYRTAQAGSCGVAYVLGAPTTPIAYYSNYAYSVVSDGKDTAGTGYYCSDYSFTHEMGHNMGSVHDRATMATQGNGVGAYAYSYGYGMAGTFGTIMSYINPRIGKFSNPKDLTCGGKYVCGVSETNTASSANNVLSLNNTALPVSKFKAKVVPDTVTVSGVVSRAGVAVAGVVFTPSGSSPSGTAATCVASGTTGAYSCTLPLDWSGSITPTQAGASFSPATLSYTGVLAAQVNQNFTKN